MQPKSCPLIAKEVVSGQVTPPSNLARHTNVEVSATSAISHSDTILILVPTDEIPTGLLQLSGDCILMALRMWFWG